MRRSVLRRATPAYAVAMVARLTTVKFQVVGAVTVSVILGIVSQHRVVDANQIPTGTGNFAILWSFLALSIFGIVLWRIRPRSNSRIDPVVSDSSLQWLFYLLVGAGLFLLVVATGSFFRLWDIGNILPGLNLRVFANYVFAFSSNPWNFAIAWWFVALGVFVFALWRARGIANVKIDLAASDRPQGRSFSPRAVVALFLLVMAVGIYFRLWNIGSTPPGLNHDAAWNGLYAIKITQAGMP